MKAKNHEIYNSLQPLKAISSFSFKGVVIFKLAKLLNFVEEHYNFLEYTKNKLIMKYGENGQITRDHLNYKPFFYEWAEVLQKETEVNLEPIKLSELNLEENPIPVEQLAKLQWIIEED